MVIVHIPYWGRENPYQKLLLESLKRLGLKIETFRAREIFFVIFRLFKRNKPQVFHLHWQHPFLVSRFWVLSLLKSAIFILLLIIIKSFGVKIVWTVHNIKGHENTHPKLELLFSRKIAHLADAIIVHCEKAKQKVFKELGLKDAAKITVISHGNYTGAYKNTISRVEARKKLSSAEKSFIFLYLGEIRPYKGIFDLIKAYKRLKNGNTRLIIAGKPRDPKLTEQIKKEISNRVDIKARLEFIPDDEIQIYMNAADVVVLPFRDVLTSGAVILAMSFGKPIIVPDTGCILETLDGRGGFIYESKLPDGLLNALQKAQIKKTHLQGMGKHNLELAKKLAWDDIAKSTFAVYKKVVV